MEKYFKVFLLFVIIYHQVDQFGCENSINDGIFPDNCGIGLYQCRNGACINESLLCDGKRDCQNGDDEDGCIFVNGNTSYPCAKTNGQCTCYGDSSSVTLNCTEAGLVSFPKLINKRGIQHIFIKGNKTSKLTSSGTFSNLWNLEALTLQNNTISIIENNTFMGLGVVLLGSGIATREKSVDIDLSDNNITKLISRMFETVHSSVHFSLARNQISDIENDTFVDLTVEDLLDLSSNKLTTLRPGMFDGIKKVVGLFLQDNEISVIENNTFRANNFRNDFGVDITVLNISNNKITTLKPGMFAGLRSLFDLHLQNNQIDTIENNTFDSLYMLTELNLYGNKLSKLTPGMFDTSPNLLIRSLNLRNNEISIIERNTFNSLTGLEILDLSHNKLKKLEAYTFENNQKLKNILLSGNEISYIESTTFYGLPNLDILNLTNNPLHDVDKDLFRGNPQMYHLFVDDLHICCQTHRTNCNGEFDNAHFCENHTIAYVLVGIFLVIVIIFILAVIKFNVFNIKKCFSRQSYTVPNQGPHQL